MPDGLSSGNYSASPLSARSNERHLMGNIADRLAVRHDPLYEDARALLTASSERANNLTEMLARHLSNKSPRSFARMLDIASLTAHRGTAHSDLGAGFKDILEPLCSTLRTRNGEEVGSCLFAVPFLIRDPEAAFSLPLKPNTLEALGRCLKSHWLVGRNASLTLLPQVLSLNQVEGLGYADVYCLTRRLFDSAGAQASDLIPPPIPGGGADSKNESDKPATPMLSLGFFAGLVCASEVDLPASDDGSLFPLSDSYRSQAQGVCLSDGEKDEYSRYQDQLAIREMGTIDSRVAQLLRLAGDDIANLVDVTHLRLLAAPSSWYADIAAARPGEREVVAAAQLQEVGDAHAQGKLSNLCVDAEPQPAELPAGNWAMHLVRKDDRRHVGTVAWLNLEDESEDDCEQAMTEFLEREGLVQV